MGRWNRTISRRDMLRGAGAMVALPWLEAMASPVAGLGRRPPVRFATIFVPNGVLGEKWTPKKVGRRYELSPTLEPLAKVKKKLLVLTNLRNKNSMVGDGHYVKSAGFLTGLTIHKTGGKDIENGVSLDQWIAQRIRRETPLDSLVLGMDPAWRAVDMGYTTVYGAHVSWSTPQRPAAREIDPRQAFNRLFRASRLGDHVNRSVLDVVLDDARDLRRRLGHADREKLGEYLESIHELERRLEALSASGGDAPDIDPKLAKRVPTEKYSSRSAKFTERLRFMMDLVVTAFRTDCTRVATLMIGNAVSQRNYGFLKGVRGAHHEISHHENQADKKRMYQIINRYHVQQLAYLLERMDQTPDGHGTSLLDNSVVLYGSGIRDGNKHDPNNLPILLAGRGGGRLSTGTHLRLDRRTPLCRLYLSIIEAMGLRTNQFGDATKRLDSVLT